MGATFRDSGCRSSSGHCRGRPRSMSAAHYGTSDVYRHLLTYPPGVVRGEDDDASVRTDPRRVSRGHIRKEARTRLETSASRRSRRASAALNPERLTVHQEHIMRRECRTSHRDAGRVRPHHHVASFQCPRDGCFLSTESPRAHSTSP